MIPLNDSHPFELDEFVKILRKSDFEKPSNTSCLGVKNFQFLTDWKYVKVLTEREQLKKEINELTILLETQRNYIASLENSLNNEPKNKNKSGIFKDLIKI